MAINDWPEDRFAYNLDDRLNASKWRSPEILESQALSNGDQLFPFIAVTRSTTGSPGSSYSFGGFPNIGTEDTEKWGGGGIVVRDGKVVNSFIEWGTFAGSFWSTGLSRKQKKIIRNEAMWLAENPEQVKTDKRNRFPWWRKGPKREKRLQTRPSRTIY